MKCAVVLGKPFDGIRNDDALLASHGHGAGRAPACRRDVCQRCGRPVQLNMKIMLAAVAAQAQLNAACMLYESPVKAELSGVTANVVRTSPFTGYSPASDLEEMKVPSKPGLKVFLI